MLVPNPFFAWKLCPVADVSVRVVRVVKKINICFFFPIFDFGKLRLISAFFLVFASFEYLLHLLQKREREGGRGGGGEVEDLIRSQCAC